MGCAKSKEAAAADVITLSNIGPGGAAPASERAEKEADDVKEEMSEPTMYPKLRCYLVWSESSQGSLFTHWSETPVEGAVAKFKPRKAVPTFKISANGGRAELSRDCKKNPARFYSTICGFIKQARTFLGPFTFLAQGRASHVDLPFRAAIYLSSEALAIVKVQPGDEVESLADVLAVGVVPENATAFDGVLTMQTELFQHHAAKLGATLMLA